MKSNTRKLLPFCCWFFFFHTVFIFYSAHWRRDRTSWSLGMDLTMWTLILFPNRIPFLYIIAPFAVSVACRNWWIFHWDLIFFLPSDTHNMYIRINISTYMYMNGTHIYIHIIHHVILKFFSPFCSAKLPE